MSDPNQQRVDLDQLVPGRCYRVVVTEQEPRPGIRLLEFESRFVGRDGQEVADLRKWSGFVTRWENGLRIAMRQTYGVATECYEVEDPVARRAELHAWVRQRQKAAAEAFARTIAEEDAKFLGVVNRPLDRIGLDPKRFVARTDDFLAAAVRAKYGTLTNLPGEKESLP